ncbi:MAG: SDR family oxidoreductase [Myxococcota bacterium]
MAEILEMEPGSGKRPSARNLRGKVALVTGAGQRVGAAIARALGSHGMHVAIGYGRSREGAEQTARDVAQLGGQGTIFQQDLRAQGAGRALARRVIDKLGGLHVLVPSAANFERIAFGAIDDGHWDRALQLNVRAAFDMVHEARDALAADEGAVVFITGFSTQAPYRDYLPYVVSKGAVRQLMRVLSLEMAPRVRVNAVAPGTVLPPEDYSAAEVEALVSDTPLRRVGSAEVIADAVVHLARADYTTGQELVVDGGRTVAK